MSESGNQMRIKLKPSAFKDITPRFQLKHNSTAKQTREQQLQSMQDQLMFMGKLPNALDQYRESTGKVPDWEFIFGEMGKLSDLPFMSKMFTNATQAPQPTTPAGQEPLPVPPAGAPQPAPAMPPQPVAPPVDPNAVPQPGMPPVAPQPVMPAGMQPTPTAPPQLQPDPEELEMVRNASPENPVIIGGYPFTNPNTAMQAYEMALMAAMKTEQGVPAQ